MADTSRSKSDVLALLADNTTGDISPQDLRDALVSQYERGPTVSIQDFAPTADGLTDDSTAFSSAMADAGTFGSVYFPKGRYLLNGSSTPWNMCNLLGESLSDVHIVGLSGKDIFRRDPAIFATQRPSVEIRNLRITVRPATDSAAASTKFNRNGVTNGAIVCEHSAGAATHRIPFENAFVENLWITGAASGNNYFGQPIGSSAGICGIYFEDYPYATRFSRISIVRTDYGLAMFDPKSDAGSFFHENRFNTWQDIFIQSNRPWRDLAPRDNRYLNFFAEEQIDGQVQWISATAGTGLIAARNYYHNMELIKGPAGLFKLEGTDHTVDKILFSQQTGSDRITIAANYTDIRDWNQGSLIDLTGEGTLIRVRLALPTTDIKDTTGKNRIIQDGQLTGAAPDVFTPFLRTKHKHPHGTITPEGTILGHDKPFRHMVDIAPYDIRFDGTEAVSDAIVVSADDTAMFGHRRRLASATPNAFQFGGPFLTLTDRVPGSPCDVGFVLMGDGDTATIGFGVRHRTTANSYGAYTNGSAAFNITTEWNTHWIRNIDLGQAGVDTSSEAFTFFGSNITGNASAAFLAGVRIRPHFQEVKINGPAELGFLSANPVSAASYASGAVRLYNKAQKQCGNIMMVAQIYITHST